MIISTLKGLLTITITLAAIAATQLACADWTIGNEQSQIQFTSIKKGSVAEVHYFNSINGCTDNKGSFSMVIDLASADTNIAIRNDRISKFLFEITEYSAANVSASAPAATLKLLQAGTSTHLETELSLNLHAVTKQLNESLLLCKLNDNTLIVSSYKPIILNARDFKLTKGIEILRELAGLSSISRAIPVTFNLTMSQ